MRKNERVTKSSNHGADRDMTMNMRNGEGPRAPEAGAHGASATERELGLATLDGPRKNERRAALYAKYEVAWFLGELGGRIPEEGDAARIAAAGQVRACLAGLLPFHRGALMLRYTPRTWPAFLVEELGDFAAVAVRLECALHPAVGQSNEALEQASVERLRRAILAQRRGFARYGCGDVTGEGDRRTATLLRRARRHVRHAMRAYAGVRGAGPCLAPCAASGGGLR